MGFHDLESKLEEAAKAYLEAETTLADRGQAAVHTGVAADGLALPRVVVMGAGGEEYPLDSGNYYLGLSVEVLSSADGADSLAAHRARCANIFDTFNNGTLATDLSSHGTNFAAQGVRNRSYSPTEREDRHWTSQFQCEVYCCPQTLS